MASVLRCRDERLDREVAVKRLHADSPSDVEQRFVREAKLGASLNHPNLVSVFDTAIDDEGVLIVMEYVEGESLSQALRRGPLDQERVATMTRDLGGALDQAHGQGVVHRDVKPGNVLLRNDGVTKLVDLGIATASDQTRITHSGMVLGTAAYMAPEQLEGGETGPATDIYALAVVAYEALTGERARPGRTPLELAHRIATEPPPDLRDALPGASPAAAQALTRAMARDPEQRQGSAGELAGELARALEEPPTARMPKPPPRSSPRRPAAVAVLALIVVALATATVIAAVLSGGDGNGGEAESAERKQQSGGSDTAEKKKKEPKQEPKQEQATPAPAEPAEEPEEEETAAIDPVRGAELNQEGFALMQEGDYAGAVPILEDAVASFAQDSRDINYAYALFNLGKSLNRSGRPDEAIPYLEKRLTWADQRATVQAELDAAEAKAG